MNFLNKIFNIENILKYILNVVKLKTKIRNFRQFKKRENRQINTGKYKRELNIIKFHSINK